MEVNLWKTRISTFNTKYQIGNYVRKFCYFDNEIGEANDYEYLDITFSVKISDLTENYKRIDEKTMQAIYAARNLTHKSLGNLMPTTLLFRILDSQMQPIVDYGDWNLVPRKVGRGIRNHPYSAHKENPWSEKTNINTSNIRRMWPLSPWASTKGIVYQILVSPIRVTTR